LKGKDQKNREKGAVYAFMPFCRFILARKKEIDLLRKTGLLVDWFIKLNKFTC
jgi:hypothetical protein